MTTMHRTRAQQRQRNLWAAAVLSMIGAAVCGFTLIIAAVFMPNTDPVSTPYPDPSTTAVATRVTPRPIPAAPAALTYAKLTARQWQRIAKDPDAYAGKAYVVHGVVTQFDAATGRDTFRANVDGVTHELAYDYTVNTILENAGADIDDLVEDDRFTARVQVLGGHTYSTALGGVTTAPMLTVHRLTRD
jgi:hypothetical protein